LAVRPAGDLAYTDAQREIQLPFFALPTELVLANDSIAGSENRLVSEVRVGFNNQAFPRTPRQHTPA